jgi:hypothetical protein
MCKRLNGELITTWKTKIAGELNKNELILGIELQTGKSYHKMKFTIIL